jgi:PAS domain S-box-containing protein
MKPTPSDPKAEPPALSPRARPAKTTTAASYSKQALVHELQVHQVELEQQNEELIRAQVDLASARDRFIDLFDFAPVGYLTLDREGVVVEANLTAAEALGFDRHTMLGRQFTHFVADSESDRWERLKASALRRGALRCIELDLRRLDGRHFHAQVDCLRVAHPGPRAQLRVTLTDISQRKLAETNRRIATSGNTARESERRAVAYQLHEDLGQRLSALKLSLSQLESSADTGMRHQLMRAMAANIDHALAAVRRMSSDLHPLMLDNLGLNSALEWLACDVATRLGLAVGLHLDANDKPLEESAAIAIYRLVEAALEHLALHVHGGVSVELLHRPHDVVLQFQSTPGHARQASTTQDLIRLTDALRDQVHLLGGRLEASELPDGTSRFTVLLPFARLPLAASSGT